MNCYVFCARWVCICKFDAERPFRDYHRGENGCAFVFRWESAEEMAAARPSLTNGD